MSPYEYLISDRLPSLGLRLNLRYHSLSNWVVIFYNNIILHEFIIRYLFMRNVEFEITAPFECVVEII